MKKYNVKPKITTTFYDFECPFCHNIITRTNKEIQYYKWDICYCGAQIIFDLQEKENKNPTIIEKIVEKVVEKPIFIEKTIEKDVQKITKPIHKNTKFKPAEVKKKYDESAYISLLKNLGMKVGPAKLLIKDLIGMGIDPNNETLFTSKLLENIR